MPASWKACGTHCAQPDLRDDREMNPTPHPTISQIRDRIASGATSHEAVVLEALEKARQPAADHVFTRTYTDAALAQARFADAALAAGIAPTPLAGLPVSIKDLYDVAGEPTQAGSIVCRDAAPAVADATIVSRLRAQGAAIVGKTNMVEFAFSGVGLNPHYGTPRNPTDDSVARVPGGSSSGAAVSVALGLAVAGIGSDTGGSIRIPAALCGLVGFKSTQSRVPRTGAFELARTLDTVCALARSVEDCIVVDGAIADQPLDVRRRPLQGMRFAVPGTVMLDGLDAAVARAFDRALRLLSAAGALIEELPFTELAEIGRLNAPGGFSAVEAYAVHRLRLAERGASFDQRVAQRIATGDVSAADYIAMHDARRDWIARAEARLQPFDAMLCPTVPIVAPAIADVEAGDEAFFTANRLLLRNTFAINYLDGCSFSLPCHVQGEPAVGLMVSSTRGDDARLAAAALAIESALG